MTMNVGDCVQLKTGGCLMTVNHVITGLVKGTEVDCVWFNDEGKLERGRFAIEALQRWVLDDQPDRHLETATEKPFDSPASS